MRLDPERGLLFTDMFTAAFTTDPQYRFDFPDDDLQLWDCMYHFEPLTLTLLKAWMQFFQIHNIALYLNEQQERVRMEIKRQ